MRVALIGCGEVSKYHVAALRAVGFDVAAVCSRPGSNRVYEFAERYAVPRVYPDAEALLHAPGGWDALVIAVPPEVTVPILSEAVKRGVPILVEKPVATSSQELEPLLGRQLPVIVGYNRRFYPSVQEIRSLVRRSPTPFLGHSLIPESISKGDEIDLETAAYKRFIYNSVHALDLLHFIFGKMEIVHVEPQKVRGGQPSGFLALLRSVDTGSLLSVTAVWNAPANLSLTLYQSDLRIQLEPFEEATIFNEMKRLEPSAEFPYRRYVPVALRSIPLDEVDLRFKPGFYRQAEALKRLLQGGAPAEAATLEDAYRALKLAEELMVFTFG